MYRSLIVENFRGFERLDAPDRRDINLVTGRNSSGKTALLEAFILHAGAVVNPQVPLWLDAWRGLDIRPPTILTGVYPDLWRSLATTARKRDVQVMATSHSLECIEAAQKVLATSAASYQLARISRDERSSRLVEYSPDVLEAALESGLEVR